MSDTFPKFEDTEPVEEIASSGNGVPSFYDTIPADELSDTESFIKGAEQGTTFGFADELAGGIQKGLEKLAQLGVPGILPDNTQKTPEEINKELLAQGITGDDLNKSTYESARDVAREEYKKAEQQNPGAYLGGNIAGGALTMMVPGGVGARLIKPVGEVIKGGSTAAKLGNVALNAAPAGALIGLGVSESEDPTTMVSDAGKGALLSAGLGVGLSGGAMAGNKVTSSTRNFVDKKLPSLARAYDKGKQGINTLGTKFQDAVNTEFNDVISKIKAPIVKRKVELTDAEKALNSNTVNLVNSVGKQIDDVKAQVKGFSDSLTGKAETKLETAKVKYSEQIVNKMLKVKDNIGKTFDAIDNQLLDKNVKFNVNDGISNFNDSLLKEGLPEDATNRIMKDFLPFFEKSDLSPAEFQQLKFSLKSYLNSPNPAIRSSAKRFYGEAAESQMSTLEQQGLSELANSLRKANNKYITFLDLEDELAGSLAKDRSLKKVVVDNKLIENLNKTLKDDAKNINTSQILSEKAQNLDPKFGNYLQNLLADLKSKQSNIQSLKALPTSNNAELQKLEAMLTQLKSGATPKIEPATQFDKLVNKSDMDIDNFIRSNLKNINNPVDETAAVNIRSLVDKASSINKDPNLMNRAKDVVKDIDLVKNATEEIRGSLSPRSLSAVETLGQYPANLAGRMVSGVNKTTDAVSRNTSTMQNVFNDDIGNILNNLRRIGTPEAEAYAKQLAASGTKSPEAKNAVLFSLMQQPAFRRMFNINEDSGK